jgi:hypothetical protein
VATPRETPLQEASADTVRGGAEKTDTRSTAQIEADIEQTRQELGETVEALTAKLDVKAKARQRLVDTKDHAAHSADLVRRRAAELADRAKVAATEGQGRSRTVVPVGAVIAVVALSVVVLRKRRHRR